MKALATLVVAGIMQLGFAHAALAQDDLAKIQSAGVLKIGTEGTYPPFTFTMLPARWRVLT